MPDTYDFMCRIQDLATLPQVALQLCQMTTREDSTIDEIEAILRLDPLLVSRLLHLVNSAYYGLRYPVHDLTKAFLILGTKALRNLVLVDALKGYFLQKRAEGNVAPTQTWLHSVAVGVGAKLICRRLLGKAGEDAFLAGLLHDLGLLVEEQLASDLFYQVINHPLVEDNGFLQTEQGVLGTDHTTVGSMLVGTWGLPSFITRSLAKHHTEFEDYALLDQPGALIQVAHVLAAEAGYRIDADENQLSLNRILSSIALNIDEFRVLLDDFANEMEAAKSIYQG